MLAGSLVAVGFLGQATADDRFRPEDREVGAREHPKLVRAFGGIYQGDPALHAYVDALGQHLAGQSRYGQDEWTFTVLDTPAVNAFALPGGYVYLTRGLIALARSGSDLGAVLAHEIAHVAARHAPARRLRTVAAERRFPDAARSSGRVGSGTVLARLRRDRFLARYSQAEELEADARAVRYLRAAGLDPAGIVRMLEANEVHAEIVRDAPGPHEPMRLSHPQPAERLRRATALVDGPTVGHPGIPEDALLDQIDGLRFGDPPGMGLVQGREVLLGGAGIRFRIPGDFRIRQETGRVTAWGEDGTRIVYGEIFHRRPAGIRAFLPRGSRGVEGLRLDGMDAVIGVRRQERGVRRFEVRTLVVRCMARRVCRLRYVVPLAVSLARAADVRKTSLSVRRLNARERRMLRPQSIRVIAVTDSDTRESLVSRMEVHAHPGRWFELLNGLQANEVPAAGTRVKIVVREP